MHLHNSKEKIFLHRNIISLGQSLRSVAFSFVRLVYSRFRSLHSSLLYRCTISLCGMDVIEEITKEYELFHLMLHQHTSLRLGKSCGSMSVCPSAPTHSIAAQVTACGLKTSQNLLHSLPSYLSWTSFLGSTS